MEGQALWDHTKHLLLQPVSLRDHSPWWWQTSHGLCTSDKTLTSLQVQRAGRSLAQVSGEVLPAGRTLRGDGITKTGKARRWEPPAAQVWTEGHCLGLLGRTQIKHHRLGYISRNLFLRVLVVGSPKSRC